MSNRIKAKISYDEVMCSVASRELQDGETVFVGQGNPILAALLALKAGKKLTLVMEGGIIGFSPYRPPIHIADMTAMVGAECCCEMVDMFGMFLLGGKIDVGFLGTSRIDKFGNLNTSFSKDPKESIRARIAGSGGANEIAGYAKRIVILLRHGKFVENLYYRTSPGWLDGGNSRRNAGLPGGPSAIITLDGVFRFEKDTKEIYLDSIFPGKNVKEIKEKVPWDLKINPDLRIEELPTYEEVLMIRQFSPNISLGRVRWGLAQADELRRITTLSLEQREKFAVLNSQSTARMKRI
ncbi:MAG: CoA-transferase [Candidatus Helarchaeota archaeon]